MESEHEYRLKYMQLKKFTYEETVAVFERTKHEAIVALTTSTQEYINKTAAALGCTCPAFRFPESERLELRARRGRHHQSNCEQFTG